MMQRILGQRKSRQIANYLTAKAFLNPLHAHTPQEAMATLSRVMRPLPGLTTDAIVVAVLERKGIMPTGLGNGVALPHARLDGLSTPVVAVGLSHAGIDFDAVDGQPAQIIILLLTPLDEDGYSWKSWRMSPERFTMLRYERALSTWGVTPNF